MKHNLLRRLLAINLFLCFFLFTSCGDSTSSLQPTDELIIYCPPDMDTVDIATAKRLFQHNFPDVDLQLKEFSNFSSEDYHDMLRTELTAGNGPDLILFNDFTFQDLSKVMKANLFFDIDQLLSEDASFDPSVYHSSMFQGGDVNGKRLYIPLRCLTYSAITTEETLRYYGITLSSHPTMEEWTNACLQFMERQKENAAGQQGQYLCSISNLPLYYYMLFDVQVFDYETGELRIDQPEFRQFMEFLKAAFPGWEAPGNEVKPATDTEIADAIRQKEIVLFFDVTYKPAELGIYNLLSDTETPKIIFLPSLEREASGSSIYGRTMAAINNASPNKRNAYEFLKRMLSYDVQKNELMIPVHNDAMRVQLTSAAVSNGRTQEETEQMYQELQNLQYKHPISTEQYKLVEEAMRPWFSDQKSYEECLEALRNALHIYIEE